MIYEQRILETQGCGEDNKLGHYFFLAVRLSSKVSLNKCAGNLLSLQFNLTARCIPASSTKYGYNLNVGRGRVDIHRLHCLVA